jgi:hypothetical protein
MLCRINQRSICIFLDKQRFSAFDIRRKLVDVLNTEAIAYSRVTRYLGEARWTTGKAEKTEMKTQDVVAQAILAVLEELPLSSVRELAKRKCIPPTTVYRRLTNSMRFIVKYLRWVPHKLNEAQLATRVQMSNEMLRIVHSAQHQGWEFLLTLDESCFDLSTDHEIICLRESEPPTEREKHMIQAKKKIIAIAGICMVFILLTPFQKKKVLMSLVTSNIS